MDATIVKIGGSLVSFPGKLRALCARLGQVSKSQKLLVVPGGGEFADTVREADKRFVLSQAASHQMAILAMDQYGFLLSDLIWNSCTAYKVEDVLKAWHSNKLPVFLPSQFLLDDDFLENSWDVTSDSIAVYIGSRMQIDKVVLVSDVDGIFTDNPKKVLDAKLIDKLSAQELLAMTNRTSVDKFLPKLLLQLRVECFVVNGQYPERVEAILNEQDTVCSRIYRSR
jgi:aspartokinase-like uncharacterized kinase